MNINSLNNVQNFSALKNNKTDNTTANPSLEEQEKVVIPQKQMVNAKTALASYTMPKINMSFKGIDKKQQKEAEFEKCLQQFIELQALLSSMLTDAQTPLDTDIFTIDEKQKARAKEIFSHSMDEQEFYSSSQFTKQNQKSIFGRINSYDEYLMEYLGCSLEMAKFDDEQYNNCLELLNSGINEKIVFQTQGNILNEKQKERALNLSQSWFALPVTNIIFSDNDTQFDIGLKISDSQILSDDDINKISELSAQFGKDEQIGKRFIQLFDKLNFGEKIENPVELLYNIYNILLSNDNEYKKIIEQLDKGETTDNILNCIKEVSDKKLDDITPNDGKLNDKDRLFLKVHAFDNEFYSPQEYASLFLYLKNLKTPNGENILNCDSFKNKIDKYGLGDFSAEQETLMYNNIEKLLSIDPASKKANYIQTILELVKKGEVNPSAFRMLSNLNDVGDIMSVLLGVSWNINSHNTDWDVSNNLKKDIELIKQNESFIKNYKNETDGIKNSKIGDAFVLDGEDFIRMKTDENKSEIVKLTKETYERLFPPVERFLTSQQIMGNCYFIETLMSMYCDDKMRINLLKAMEEDRNGNTTIKIGDYNPVTFENGKMPENEPSEIYSSGADGFKLFEYAYSCALVEDKIKEAQENLEGEQLIEFKDFIKSNPNDFYIYKDNDEIKWTTYKEAIEKELYQKDFKNIFFEPNSYKTFNNLLLGNGGMQSDVYKKFGYDSKTYINGDISKFDNLDSFGLTEQQKEMIENINIAGTFEDIKKLINTPDFFKNHQVQMGIGFHAYNLTQETDEYGKEHYYLYNPHNQGFPVKIEKLHDLFSKVNTVTLCKKTL